MSCSIHTHLLLYLFLTLILCNTRYLAVSKSCLEFPLSPPSLLVSLRTLPLYMSTSLMRSSKPLQSANSFCVTLSTPSFWFTQWPGPFPPFLVFTHLGLTHMQQQWQHSDNSTLSSPFLFYMQWNDMTITTMKTTMTTCPPLPLPCPLPPHNNDMATCPDDATATSTWQCTLTVFPSIFLVLMMTTTTSNMLWQHDNHGYGYGSVSSTQGYTCGRPQLQVDPVILWEFVESEKSFCHTFTVGCQPQWRMSVTSW